MTAWRNHRVGSLVLGAALAGVVLTGRAEAFERYNDGCQSCHGAFSGPVSPKGTVFPSDSKHDMHRGAANMDTDCNLCHTTGDSFNPFTNSSDGTTNNVGYGCAGCHGRDYGASGVRGFGLRAHHAANGVATCSICHTTGTAPLGESIAPPYYGTPDTRADSPCNSAPDFLEDWSIGDGLGLDNDGDNIYDSSDPDCVIGDCNGNGVLDDVDILEGTSLDCNGNMLPDECEPDGDGDGVIDGCDMCRGGDDDLDDDSDGIPTVCDDCPDTAAGDAVDGRGCSTADDDGDGVLNDYDHCPDTPASVVEVDPVGCPKETSDGELDDELPPQQPPGAEDEACCGSVGPLAPVGVLMGVFMLSRLGVRRNRPRRAQSGCKSRE